MGYILIAGYNSESVNSLIECKFWKGQTVWSRSYRLILISVIGRTGQLGLGFSQWRTEGQACIVVLANTM